MNSLSIAYEDEYMIICHKPAGMAVQTRSLTATDLESEVCNYLYKKGKGKNPYVGIINRLDQPVEGLVLFAKDSDTAGRLSKIMQSEESSKYYMAVVEGKPGEAETLINYLVKDGKSGSARVCLESDLGAKKAVLEYEKLEEICLEKRTLSLLKIHLITGRFHQIRIQLSNAGYPIVGDKKYNAKSLFGGELYKYPALVSCELDFFHPYSGENLDICIRPWNKIFDNFHISFDEC
ncbi:MAG: RluA family pseudouridine synthase [Lachnospiraceae bacterium]|nr:RluA family pseudouridine synthase [Lachnospiraceae bacterium]